VGGKVEEKIEKKARVWLLNITIHDAIKGRLCNNIQKGKSHPKRRNVELPLATCTRKHNHLWDYYEPLEKNPFWTCNCNSRWVVRDLIENT